MLKLKLQYFGHLMQRTDSSEKTLMLGKIEGRRGWHRMRWLDGTTNSMDMGLGGYGSWWWTGRPGMLRFMGSQRVGHNRVTELNWTVYELHTTETESQIVEQTINKFREHTKHLHTCSCFQRIHNNTQNSVHIFYPLNWQNFTTFEAVCCSVAKLCWTLCGPMDCRVPGFPTVLHYLLEFAQTPVHWVSDAIKPSCLVTPFYFCPESFPVLVSFPMSQLFPPGGLTLIEPQLQSFHWTFRVDFL